MTDRELLEFIASQVGTLTNQMSNVENQIDNVEKEVKKTNVTIEHDINPKLSALFDGYKQSSDKLDRIEQEVSKHEEIILRRIK